MRHYLLLPLTIAGRSGGVHAFASERLLVALPGLTPSVPAGQRGADFTVLLPVVAARAQHHEGVAKPAPEAARRGQKGGVHDQGSIPNRCLDVLREVCDMQTQAASRSLRAGSGKRRQTQTPEPARPRCDAACRLMHYTQEKQIV